MFYARGGVAVNLITTKLMAPRPPGSMVERPRLLHQLEIDLNTKLILISAPAGSGKSTLLAKWLQTQGHPTAWLSLDSGDNDRGRFLLYLISALQQVEPLLGEGLPDLLQARSSFEVEPIIIRIINDLAQQDRQLWLVLDDYHLITNEVIHDAVEFLLDHIPPGLCMVLATRSDPPLALSRLRVKGQLVEVRAEDLRFSLDETTAFLNSQMGLGLSREAIQNLEERTEGWVAGLQLAALSLEGRSDKEGFVERFAGSHHYLAEYLMEEVLKRQSLELQQFLKHTSILERFTAPMAEAVSGQSEAQKLMVQLDKTNLFLIPLDNKRQWYRYHHLFGEFLRHHLTETELGLVAELHQRASAWLEQAGWTEEAVGHAFQANDLARAARLIEAIAPDWFVRGQYLQLLRYIRQIPPQLLTSYPILLIYYAWTLINVGTPGQTSAVVLPLMEQCQVQLPSPEMTATLLAFRAAERLGVMDFTGTIQFLEQALNVLGAPAETSHHGKVLSFVTNTLAYTYLASGDVAKAASIYPDALELARQQDNFSGIANCATRLSQTLHLRGQLRQAREVLQEGLNILEKWGLEGGRQNLVVATVGGLHLSLASLLYEWNLLDELQNHLTQARTTIELYNFRPAMALELEISAQTYLALGQVDLALASLYKLDRLCKEVLAELQKQTFEAKAMNLRLQLATSIPGLEYLMGEVQGWLETRNLKPDDSFTYPYEGSYYVLARLLVAQNQASQALSLLERLVEIARASGRTTDLIRYQMIQAIAFGSVGLEKMAAGILQEALSLAEHEGYCRSFLDLGLPMQTLLRKLAASSDDYAYQISLAFPRHIQTLPSVPTSHKPEQLSEREQTILRLLVGGNSNKEMGRVLQLSPNTVKWYLKTLFEKLEVQNRVEAINRAREWGLI